MDRPRRGEDFFANFERALRPALAGHADLVVHGGDLLFRSRVSRQLVERALEPLRRVAQKVPVLLVPGNHERSALPYPLLAAHPGLHLFDRPKTVVVEIRGRRVAVSGFPCERHAARDRFSALLAATGWRDATAELRLLCLHQTFEGARVGPAGYTFRDGPEVIGGDQLPPGFAAVLAGHIHRHQILRRTQARRPLAAPVLYPGSVERTSWAERAEPKGYLCLDFEAREADGGRLVGSRFHRLPTRPMRLVELTVDRPGPDLEERVRRRLAALPAGAIARLVLAGPGASLAARRLGAAALRRLAPPDLLVEPLRPRSDDTGSGPVEEA